MSTVEMEMTCKENNGTWTCTKNTPQMGGVYTTSRKKRKGIPRKKRKGTYKNRIYRKHGKMYGGADTAICKCTIKKDGIVQPTRTIKNRIKNRIKSISTKKTNMTSEIRTLPEMNINSNYISSSPFDDNKMKQLIKYMYDNVSTKDPDRQNIFVQAYEKIKKEKIPFTYYDKDITQKYKEIKKKLRPGFFNIIKRKRQVMPA